MLHYFQLGWFQVLICTRIGLKVADLGLARYKRRTFLSGSEGLRGTLPWMAPELVKTPGAVDERADVFAFGIVLWEIWTGLVIIIMIIIINMLMPVQQIALHILESYLYSLTAASRPNLTSVVNGTIPLY